MRTLIVDGTNEFIRHFTVNPTLGPNGDPIGGIRGCLNSLRKYIGIVKPQKIIYVWDGPDGSAQKRKLFKEYKDGRKPTTVVGRNYEFSSPEKALENKRWQQLQLAKILKDLPVCQLVTRGCECDDAIGYLVKNREYFNFGKVVILSCDKDFFQLVEDDVLIYSPIMKKVFDSKGIVEKYGVHPKHWLFYRTIDGDPSDNLKGVKGFGPKTIQKLFYINSYNEAIPSDLEELESQFSKFENMEERLKEELANCHICSDEKKAGLCSAHQPKTKTQLKRYKTLGENLDVVKRNWKLMSLSDPLMSVAEKDRITEKIEDFKPSLNKMDFYIQVKNVGDLGVDISYTNNFLPLLRK